MSRIFAILAAFSLILLTTNILLGLRIGPYNSLYAKLVAKQNELETERRDGRGASEESAQLESDIRDLYVELEQFQNRATFHLLFGIVAALVTVLVCSISVTYFIGTSRWCKEVVETYGLEPTYAAQSAKWKRRSFPWSIGGIAAILGIVALGAASDPGTLRVTTPAWVTPHLLAALLGTGFIACSYFFQVSNIAANTELVNQILAQVQQIRQERGLDVDPVRVS